MNTENPILLRIQRKETTQDAPLKAPSDLGWYTLEDCTSSFASVRDALDHYRNLEPWHVYRIKKLKVRL